MLIGKTISHYHILQKIGGGGMGVVYKAEDTKLRRTVALKFLAPELTRDEDAKRRFVHEAQAASALDHPNICSIFDIDETPEGQLFIAMACYDGESLKERIARRRLDVREAFEIAYSVAQGLARAHASGIVHRDIKPGNIMITTDGFVKIVDFGLAKLIGRSRITGSGATLGTVAYMSPEQARSEEADERADIWSFGAVLYETLTGRIPFRGDIDQAVVYSILNEDPKPLREFRGDVPDTCAAVVAKCLKKNPDERYQSALEFCSALIETSEQLGWGGSFATGTVRAVSMVRGGRTRRRRSALSLAVGAVVLALAGTLAWRHWRSDSIYSTDVRLAVMPFERLGDTPSQAFVDGLSQWVAGMFARASNYHSSMWTVPYAPAEWDPGTSLEQARDRYGANTVIIGNTQPNEGLQRLTLTLLPGNPSKHKRVEYVSFAPQQIGVARVEIAAAVLRLLQLELAEDEIEIVAGSKDTIASATAFRLEGLGHLQHYRIADHADRALDAMTQAANTDSASAIAVAGLGLAYFRKHQRTENPELLELAKRVLLRAQSIDPSVVTPYQGLGTLYEDTGRSEEALLWLERALELEPRNIELLQRTAHNYIVEDRIDEAEQCYLRLLEFAPDYSMGQASLGWLYGRLGRYDDDFSHTKMAVDLAPNNHWALNRLGVCYYERDDMKRAREAWEKSFGLHPDCGSGVNLGNVLYFDERFEDASTYYAYVLEHCDSTDYEDWGNLAATLYFVNDRADDARAAYRRAIDLAQKELAQRPDDGVTIAKLGDYYAMMGDTTMALRMIDLASGYSDKDAFFRIACAYEVLGRREKALQFAGNALRSGWPASLMEREPVLRGMTGDPRFRKMVELSRRAETADDQTSN